MSNIPKLSDDLKERKNSLKTLIEDMSETSRGFMFLCNDVDDEHKERALAVFASLAEIETGLKELIKKTLISEGISVADGFRISKMLSLAVSEACAEATAEVLKSRSDEDAANGLSELLLEMLRSNKNEEVSSAGTDNDD